MNAICLIDTSIFTEVLNVPVKATKHKNIILELEKKIKSNELLFLPMATILETGNHIAQNGNGDQRYLCGERFVSQVQKALEGQSPFKPIDFLKPDELKKWLAEFPDSAKRGNSLGDLSIIHDWERQCRLNPSRRVYIWSLDRYLSSYDRIP